MLFLTFINPFLIRQFIKHLKAALNHRNGWHYINQRKKLERKMSLKEVAEHIVIDVSILSKIEYGDQLYLKESLEKYLKAK